MTVTELLALVDATHTNTESVANKVSFMNIALRGMSPYFGLVVEDDSLVTVADQDAYSYPTGLTDVSQIISLAVANVEVPTTRYQYTQYSQSKRDDDPMWTNSYWQIIDSNGAKKLCLYPIPSTADLPIIIRFRKALTALSASALTVEPEFDSRFHDMLAFYCVHYLFAYGSNPDTTQANAYMQKYEDRYAEFWKFEMEKASKQGNRKTDNRQWHRSKSFGRGF